MHGQKYRFCHEINRSVESNVQRMFAIFLRELSVALTQVPRIISLLNVVCHKSISCLVVFLNKRTDGIDVASVSISCMRFRTGDANDVTQSCGWLFTSRRNLGNATLDRDVRLFISDLEAASPRRFRSLSLSLANTWTLRHFLQIEDLFRSILQNNFQLAIQFLNTHVSRI